MPLSTEFFVMIIFIAGIPFFYFMLKDMDLQGRSFFIRAYICLALSNIFTVAEEFWLNRLFNFCEHLFKAFASLMILIAVIQLTSKKQQNNMSGNSDERNG